MELDNLTLTETLRRRPHYYSAIAIAVSQFLLSRPDLKGTAFEMQLDEIEKKARRDYDRFGDPR